MLRVRHAVEQSVDVGGFRLGEGDVFVQSFKERRFAVEPILRSGFHKLKTQSFQVLEIVIDLASTHAQSLGQLARRVVFVLGQE